MTREVRLCACGCGRVVPHSGQYVEVACRVRAHRERKRREVRPLPEVLFRRSCVTPPGETAVSSAGVTAGRYAVDDETAGVSEYSVTLQQATGARVLPVGIDGPARFAYADPPYPGCAHLYKSEPYTAEVNLPVLVGTLCALYPDGWALSTGGRHIQSVLALCPEGVHVGAWTKPGYQRPTFRHRCWEPVIFCGGRWRRDLEVRDTYDGAPPTFPGFHGAKPVDFGMWVFLMLGAEPGDEFDDLFPGRGNITRAWQRYTLESVTAGVV